MAVKPHSAASGLRSLGRASLLKPCQKTGKNCAASYRLDPQMLSRARANFQTSSIRFRVYFQWISRHCSSNRMLKSTISSLSCPTVSWLYRPLIYPHNARVTFSKTLKLFGLVLYTKSEVQVPASPTRNAATAEKCARPLQYRVIWTLGLPKGHCFDREMRF